MSEPRRNGPPGLDASPLAQRIVAFGRMLRRAGLRVGSGQIMDALHAVDLVGVRRRDDLYQALFSLFVQHQGQVELFDEAFELFWRTPSELPDVMHQLLPDAQVPPQGPKERVQEALKEPDAAAPPPPPKPPPEEEDDALLEVELVATYSGREVLRQKDFADFTADEVEEAKAFLQKLQWPVDPQRVRRRTPRAKGRMLDVRRTIRRAMRHQGEILHLQRLGPKEKPRPIVVLCDISGSMEPYARMLLHFMHALTGGMERVESFVFGTRLTRITRYLQRRDIDEALDAVTDHVNDWSGGTRIGEALRTFNYEWTRRVLRSGGVVLVISDGCDRGDVEVLRQAMSRLARTCHRLLWLNPLLRYSEYEPLTRGMQAALPFVDDFLPVHNLDSLDQLGRLLTDIGRRSGPSWREMYDWKVEGRRATDEG